MENRLKGKTILITGASAGIGRSTALEFAKVCPKDLRLILTARRVDRLKECADEIERFTGKGVKVLCVKLDISDTNEVKSFMKSLPAEFEDIDILVNNAGVGQGSAVAPYLKPEDIKLMIRTNLEGVINMTQAVLPIFLKRSNGGRGDVINVGSIAGRDPYPGSSVYCATKAAVRSFTETLRKEYVASQIRFMEIAPGQVRTEWSANRYYGDQKKADEGFAGRDPLTGEDVAEIIVFVASRRQNTVVADVLVFPKHQAAGAFTDRPSSELKPRL